MTSFKPLLLTLMIVLGIGIFMNVFVSPFVDNNDKYNNPALTGLIDFIENGFEFTILGVDFSMSPATWFWFSIDSVTDFVVQQLELFQYIPPSIAWIIIITSLVALGFSVVSLIRGN